MKTKPLSAFIQHICAEGANSNPRICVQKRLGAADNKDGLTAPSNLHVTMWKTCMQLTILNGSSSAEVDRSGDSWLMLKFIIATCKIPKKLRLLPGHNEYYSLLVEIGDGNSSQLEYN